jgi:chromate transporter
VIPTSLLALAAGRFLSRAGDTRALKAIKAGLVPLAVGLILASGFVLARVADRDALTAAITLIAALALLLTRINPIWLMAGAAGIGVALRGLSP